MNLPVKALLTGPGADREKLSPIMTAITSTTGGIVPAMGGGLMVKCTSYAQRSPAPCGTSMPLGGSAGWLNVRTKPEPLANR